MQNNPLTRASHYTKDGIEPIDYIVANKLGFEAGNIIKYCSRYKAKNGIVDLEKAMVYLSWLIIRERFAANGINWTVNKKDIFGRKAPEFALEMTERIKSYVDGAVNKSENMPDAEDWTIEYEKYRQEEDNKARCNEVHWQARHWEDDK